MHPVGYFLEKALACLDKRILELHAYANQHGGDELTERLRCCFTGWHYVAAYSDEQLAARIRDDRIDILIDLAGHTAASRLPVFALKPALLLVSWLGYCHTTGLKAMDYILADPVTLPPGEESLYTEKPLRLPDSYLCYTPPEHAPEVAPLPALSVGNITFVSFNNPSKINAAVIDCWGRILAAVPDSVLLLKFRNYFAAPQEREVFRGQFSANGVDAERIRFSDDSDHQGVFDAYRQADIALDTFPYNGVTTTCEALWMGVPTLTLSSSSGIFSHNGEMIMRSVGLPEWVTTSAEEYVTRAIEMASDLERLSALRLRLRQMLRDSCLCDAPRFARHLENALLAIAG
jgi:predicted O-linked N-acetylglucosamine transferase (SPINDLY family)